MKKQWNTPTLEVLDVKNTFNDVQPAIFCPPGKKWSWAKGKCVS